MMDEFSKEFNDKIKASYEAGFTPEEIMAHLEETKHPEGAKWAEKMKMLENASDVTPIPSEKSKGLMNGINLPNLTDSINSLPWWAPPAAVATLGALATGAVMKSGKSSIEARRINKAEPFVDTGLETATPEQMKRFESHPVFQENPNIVTQEQFDLQQKGLANRAANQANFKPLSDLPTNPVAPEDQVLKAVDPLQAIKDKQALARLQAQQSMQQAQSPQAVAQRQAPQAPIPTSVSPEEASVISSVSNAAKDPLEKVEQATEVKSVENAIKPELRTGSGMPAIQGTAPPGTPLRKELTSIANLPSTHAFVPGGQYMDIVRNAVGQDAFTASLLKEGGYPQTPEEAYSLSRLINEKTGRLPRDVAKDLNIGLGDTTKAITQKVAGGKAVKLAGATGALILMSDLANAKTAKEKREALRNLGEAILPPSLTATEAGAPTLPPNAYSESRKLGSPFRQQLLGIAPPTR